jgi:hypothetical protein
VNEERVGREVDGAAYDGISWLGLRFSIFRGLELEGVACFGRDDGVA